MATPTSAPELSQDDIQRMRFRKAMARKKRRDREAEGEIKELNITAMMDLMTIILVFLIKSFSASSITVTASERRSQLRNREAAACRMAALLRSAIAPPPKPRRPTSPSRAAVERRLTDKKAQSQRKAQRRRPAGDW